MFASTFLQSKFAFQYSTSSFIRCVGVPYLHSSPTGSSTFSGNRAKSSRTLRSVRTSSGTAIVNGRMSAILCWTQSVWSLACLRVKVLREVCELISYCPLYKASKSACQSSHRRLAIQSRRSRAFCFRYLSFRTLTVAEMSAFKA